MTASVPDLAFVLVLVLPGFLSYRTALARYADASRRTTLWQLSAMLEHSVYIHAVGLALFLGMSAALGQLFSAKLHYAGLLDSGMSAYFAGHPTEATISLFLYMAYVLAAAELFGAYNVPHRIASRFSKGADLLAGRVRGLPHPRPATSEQPVWYDAFHEATNSYEDGPPQLIVKLNSGDNYFGELAAYPILGDEVVDKDFLLRKAVYVPADGSRGMIDLGKDDSGGGAVLLNTSNVDSIQIYYG